ncbi:DUF2279 domain-containing protein [Gaetbulibacter saemankumensis]|uniref:DUF2279 domain-containing protein n=1 Tax=Gaetbulibacter saemankumensis TaxID=311208 RepID=UPI0003F91609|nr:DUF2279 domain-containing protein [Gaetbulibacter saemankumensis]
MKQSSGIYLLFFVFIPYLFFAQSNLDSFLTPSDTLIKSRRNAVIISEASLASISLIGLNQLWYANYKQSKFHTTYDNNQWYQMDKIGHAFTAYQIGKHGAQLLNWSGVQKKDQLLYGATLGFTFLTAVELFDGFSKEWGFSWGDMAANAAGTGLYVGQELLWQEQRIALKFSYHQTQYANQRPEILGHGFFEELLKDYNGQTYWLSVNLHSFFKEGGLPKWLNVAFGYGATGMISGRIDSDLISLNETTRYRQFFLSLDLNLKSIHSKSKILNVFLDVFDMIKIPFPALEFNKKGGAFHLFYY